MGPITRLPDFAADHGFDLNTVLGLVGNTPEDQLRAAESLWFLSGKAVTVRRDGKYGQTILDYRDTLPDDLAPLLVLDASGRVRTTYRQWQQRRGGLVILPTATKRYDNLTVHIWETGGSKSSFRENGEALVEGIARTINTKPGEEWLVVHHKSGVNMDVEEAIRSRLTGDQGRVHFLTWGCHDATNRFSHVPNVILAGTLFYRASLYEARGRLASRHPSADGSFAEGDIREIVQGENHHLILQALCRGAVRRCEGEVCAPANAYIIASARSGIPATVPTVFPGCEVIPWNPVQQRLTGKIAQAVEFIAGGLKANPTGILSFSEVQAAICMADKSNFKRLRRREDFTQALAGLGIGEGNDKSHLGFALSQRSPDVW